MKAKNKIISLLVTVATVASMFSCFTTVVSAKKYPKADEAVAVLSKLDILETKYNPEVETTVTREEFAVTVANAVKAPEVSDIRFVDVDRNNSSMEKLNGLYDMGIISGYNRSFDPDRAITALEAATIALNAVGRSYYVNSSKANDALNLAKDLDIFNSSVSQNDTLGVGEMAQVVYQMMQVTTMQTVGYENGEVKMKDSGKTLFEMNYDVKIIEGYIDGIYGTCLNEEINLEENEISVNGEEYALDYAVDQIDVLGKNMKIVYSEDSKDNKTIIYLTEYKEFEEIVIEDDEYVSFDFDKYEINYYVNETKTKTAELSRGARFVYNGETLQNNIKSLMASLDGTYDNLKITLRDTDGEEGLDLVIIEEYENFYVTGIDLNSKIVYGTNAGKQVSVNVSDLKVDYLTITDRTFETLELDELKTDSILSVFKSRDEAHVKLIMSVVKMEGMIKNRDNDDHTFEIDDTVYEVDGACWATDVKNIKADNSYTAFLDYKGKVARLEAETAGTKVWGYLIKARIDSTNEEDIILKLLSQDGTIKEYKLSEKPKIDGVSYKNEDPEVLIQKIGETWKVKGKNVPKPQLLRFKTNSKEEITWIDTVKTTGSEDKKDAMVKNEDKYRSDNSMAYTPSLKRFGFKTLVDSDTIFFVVPEVNENGDLIAKNDGKSLGIRATDADYSVTTNTYTNAWYVGIVGYTIGDDKLTQDVVVQTKRSGTSLSSVSTQILSVVQNFETTLNDDDEVTTSVTIINGNGEYTYQALNSAMTDGINVGDIVEVSLDNNNIIVGMKKYYDWKNDKLDIGWNSPYQWRTDSGYRQEFQITCGKVEDNQNGIVKIQYTTSSGDTYTGEIIDLSSAKVVVHDKTKKKNSTYLGTVGDVTTYKQVGSNCSKIFIHTRNNELKSVIVYK